MRWRNLQEMRLNPAGCFKAAGCLRLRRARVSGFLEDKVTALDGPFTEAKEIVGGFAMFELKSKEEVIEGAMRFMELHKKYWTGWEGETEVRQIYDPEDFPPKP